MALEKRDKLGLSKYLLFVDLIVLLGGKAGFAYGLHLRLHSISTVCITFSMHVYSCGRDLVGTIYFVRAETSYEARAYM